jgi:transcription initiation factor TFIIIB Brf1 subunit/transcription initiation factor TFIIB
LANGDISGEEWLDLYRYLLTRLEERSFSEVRAEIEAAASAPVVEESTPEDEARISKIVSGEVGKAIIRRRSPEEVFRAAVGVLQSRLVELPAVADSLAKHLEVPLQKIEFRVDYEQRYALVESDPVHLRDLVVSGGDVEIIRRDLSVLGAVLGQIQG